MKIIIILQLIIIIILLNFCDHLYLENKKYQTLTEVFDETSKMVYSKEYNCHDFTMDAIVRFSQKGIPSQYSKGYIPWTPECPEESTTEFMGEKKCYHAVVSIPFEPQTGLIAKDFIYE